MKQRTTKGEMKNRTLGRQKQQLKDYCSTKKVVIYCNYSNGNIFQSFVPIAQIGNTLNKYPSSKIFDIVFTDPSLS